MRHNLLSTTALSTSAVFMAGAAVAADIPRAVTKAPVAVRAPAYSWTGCYAGLNAGAAWSRVDQNLNVPAPVNQNFAFGGRDTSFTGGGQLGCNWQFNPVIGIEGDFNYIHAKRSGQFSFGAEDTAGRMETKLRWLATLRGRLGVTMSPTLIYVTGGAAFGDVQSSVSAVSTIVPATYAGSLSEVRVGWTVGGGVEHAFRNRWSAKLEYLYYDLGSFSYNVNRTSGAAVNVPATWFASGKIDGHIVRLGVNYRLSP
jgi:outer membrane immunogenic protein